jgi:hypothetical protein
LIMRSVRSLFMLVVVTSVLLSGCVRYSASVKQDRTVRQTPSAARALAKDHELVFTCRTEGRDVILESEKLTLIFPAALWIERKAFDGEEFWIQVGGHGSSEIVRSNGGHFGTAKFHARYKDGVNTIQFCGREVRLENAARTVIVGEKTFELTPDEKIVRVLARAE